MVERTGFVNIRGLPQSGSRQKCLNYLQGLGTMMRHKAPHLVPHLEGPGPDAEPRTAVEVIAMMPREVQDASRGRRDPYNIFSKAYRSAYGTSAAGTIQAEYKAWRCRQREWPAAGDDLPTSPSGLQIAE